MSLFSKVKDVFDLKKQTKKTQKLIIKSIKDFPSLRSASLSWWGGVGLVDRIP